MAAPSRTIALLLMGGALAACGSEPSTPSPAAASAGKAACVPHGDGRPRLCGLAPPRRGTAYKLTTIVGESVWVSLPAELAPSAGVVAIPGVPARVNADLTTMPAREAVDRFCEGFPECEPTAVGRDRLPAHMIRWDDASGSIRDLEVTTVDFGSWRLVFLEPDARHAERIGRALSLSADADGYPHLASSDPGVPLYSDWADVQLWIPDPGNEGGYHLIRVVPGCRVTANEPDDLDAFDAGPELEVYGPGAVAGGRWCVDGRYLVDVAFAGRPELELLHEQLRIAPAA